MTTRRRRRKDEEEPAEVRHTYITMMMILMMMMMILMMMLTIQAKAGADQSKLGVETNISPLTNFTTRLETKYCQQSSSPQNYFTN